MCLCFPLVYVLPFLHICIHVHTKVDSPASPLASTGYSLVQKNGDRERGSEGGAETTREIARDAEGRELALGGGRCLLFRDGEDKRRFDVEPVTALIRTQVRIRMRLRILLCVER
jgi:hypothetical protein